MSIPMRSYKDGVSKFHMYPYPMKWSERKVPFYDQLKVDDDEVQIAATKL